MVTREKLAALNEGRAPADGRRVGESLAPFDIDACGTVAGNAGSGVIVTTLEFALRHRLDVTSIIAGFGQSGETGGKGHFAGVGFGGENALIAALNMAHQAHGYGLGDFKHFIAHATGTRTNSKTDLGTAHAARLAAADMQGFRGPLPAMTVGAPKALGDGHSMGETGLKSASEAIHYLLGQPTVGVPSLRRRDPALEELMEHFRLSADAVPGDADGGVLTATQGFGGYVGAIALRAANPDTLRRYSVSDPRLLSAYLEAWPELRRERTEREATWRRTRGAIRRLGETHRWAGTEG